LATVFQKGARRVGGFWRKIPRQQLVNGGSKGRMDPVDAADTIQDAAEEQAANERFRRKAALAIGVLAMLLAISGLGGENATKETVNANIFASDTWAFYQAKNIRQTSTQLAADELEVLLATDRDLPPETRANIEQWIERYKATVARYESEPDPSDPTNPLKGEGKRELSAQARNYEQRREHAQRQDPNFDYSVALFQIAIVLGSVSIVAASRPILWLGLGVGAAAALLLINGFLLILELPVG
jgi:hypothetical protein